jgi:RNA polymerase sigma factor (TIGR02999 family)
MLSGSDRSGEITVLLHQWRQGDAAAGNHLFEIVEPNLRKLAHYLMKREWKDHPLQATELVSEAYLELLAAKDRDWQSRKHFFALAATIMRRYLIDLSRKSTPVQLPQDAVADQVVAESPEQAVALGELLDQLAIEHAEWCTVVEMKHFLGFTDEETGRQLGVPIRTVQRMWHDGRLWLYDRRNTRTQVTSV